MGLGLKQKQQYKLLCDAFTIDVNRRLITTLNTNYILHQQDANQYMVRHNHNTRYVTITIHVDRTAHCPERVFTTHNRTPQERKTETRNMTIKVMRNTTQHNQDIKLNTLHLCTTSIKSRRIIIAEKYLKCLPSGY